MQECMPSSTELLLITYEFTYGTFSGNGILARSLVKSLLRQGCHVTVWCCKPPPPNNIDVDSNDNNNEKDQPLTVPELDQDQMDRLRVISTTLASRRQWHRLDDASAWKSFVWDSLREEEEASDGDGGACGHPNSQNQQSVLWKAARRAKAVLVIDWTGHHAWKSIPPMTGGNNNDTTTATVPPLVYLNFRVFSSGVRDAPKRRWYDERERHAVLEASLVVALSQKDKASLKAMADTTHTTRESTIITTTTTPPSLHDKIQVLVPPLRGDIEALALQHKESDNPTTLFLNHMPAAALNAITNSNNSNTSSSSSSSSSNNKTDNHPRKCFITCVVRLSPEKNVRRFIRFLEATKDLWQTKQWIPLLAGSSSDPDYARAVQHEFQVVCGDNRCVLLDSFLPPASLAAVLSCAVVNIHPCSYDAYGMTIMESAALGVPSVIAAGGHVGASLHVGNDASIEVEMSHHDEDMTSEAVSQVVSVLQDTTKLERLGEEAQRRALAWDEDAYGKALLQHIQSIQYNCE